MTSLVYLVWTGCDGYDASLASIFTRHDLARAECLRLVEDGACSAWISVRKLNQTSEEFQVTLCRQVQRHRGFSTYVRNEQCVLNDLT